MLQEDRAVGGGKRAEWKAAGSSLKLVTSQKTEKECAVLTEAVGGALTSEKDTSTWMCRLANENTFTSERKDRFRSTKL